MKYPKISNASDGTTIIEMIVVIGILGILLGLSAPTLFKFYNQSSARGERDTLIALLREARNLALVNDNNDNHGLYIASTEYIIFKGTSYDTRDSSYDQDFPRLPGITIAGPSEIGFKRLSGKASNAAFTLSNDDITFTVTVNQEGRIDWQ